jgi:diguanylate cyclase (GGDEF)-like protein
MSDHLAGAPVLRCPLTRLPTRVLLHEHARMALNRARRHDREVALLHLGLDDFRLVNDSLGRQAGDRVLREAAARLAGTVPDVLVLARVAGDEFCALLADLGGDAEALVEAVAGHMRSALDEPFVVDGRSFSLGATMGASRFPVDAADEEALFKHAEAAMRQAKELERGSLVCYAGGTADALERLLLTGRLRGALDRDEFTLEYQPIYEPGGRIFAVEALLRWEDPLQGRIEPLRFIPSAEHSGLIGPIGDWVVDAACAQVRRWLDLAIEMRVTVNVSLRQFRDPEFVARLREALARHGVPPSQLIVEVTESTAMREPHCVEPVLEDLRRLGVLVAIDDFGVGYSSLGRLRDMPVDILKLDGTFLPRSPGDERAARLLGASLDLVAALGMAAVVEGVETGDHERLLSGRADGCLVQGFHYARPMPAADVTRLLPRS